MKEKIKKYFVEPIWFYLAGIVFMFFQITGYLLAKNETIVWTVTQSAFIIIASVFFGTGIGALVHRICEKYFESKSVSMDCDVDREQNVCEKQKKTWKIMLFSFCIILLCWLPLFAAYFPGIGSYDYGNQMISFIQDDITTHHPIIHTELMGRLWLWSFTELGSGTIGLAVYTTIQILFMALAFSYAIVVLYKLGMSDKGSILFAIFLGIFPLNGYMAISATKDGLFSASFLLVMVSLLYLLLNKNYNGFYIANIGVLLASVFGTIAFRNNGRYAMMALLAGILLVNILEKFKNARCLVAGIMVVLAFTMSIGKIQSIEAEYYNPTKDQNEKYSVPFLQVTRTAAYHHDDMDADDLAYLEECFYEGFYNDYNPVLADEIKDSFDTKGYLKDERTLEIYLKLFKEYPGEYLNAFLVLDAGYLYLFDTSCFTPYTEAEEKGFGYIITNENITWMESIGVYKHSAFPWLYNWLEEILTSNTLVKIPLLGQIMRPAMWLYIYLFIVATSLTYKKFHHLIPLSLLGGLYVTILLGPVVLMRYIYPIMLGLMVYLFRYGEVFFGRWKETKKVDKKN